DFHVTGVQTCALPISGRRQLPRYGRPCGIVAGCGARSVPRASAARTCPTRHVSRSVRTAGASIRTPTACAGDAAPTCTPCCRSPAACAQRHPCRARSPGVRATGSRCSSVSSFSPSSRRSSRPRYWRPCSPTGEPPADCHPRYRLRRRSRTFAILQAASRLVRDPSVAASTRQRMSSNEAVESAPAPDTETKARTDRQSSRWRSPDEPCLNCGDPTYGRYCPSCGQRKLEVEVSVRTMLKDVLEDQLALSGALPRTLVSLLFRPGHLTNEYIR